MTCKTVSQDNLAKSRLLDSSRFLLKPLVTQYYSNFNYQVTGEASEIQLLTSLRRYQTRSKYLLNAIRELFSLIRGPTNHDNEGEICMVSLQFLSFFL